MVTESNREKILRLKQEHPDWTLLHIGSEVGVTKQRIRQVLIANNISTKRHKEYYSPCIVCENLVLNKTSSKAICSEKCRQKLFWVELICGHCKEIIVRRKSHVTRDLKKNPDKVFFCSQSCRSFYLWDSGTLVRTNRNG